MTTENMLYRHTSELRGTVRKFADVQEDVHRKAQAYQNDKRCTYKEAIEAVFRLDPELKKQYALSK